MISMKGKNLRTRSRIHNRSKIGQATTYKCPRCHKALRYAGIRYDGKLILYCTRVWVDRIRGFKFHCRTRLYLGVHKGTKEEVKDQDNLLHGLGQISWAEYIRLIQKRNL